MSGIAPERWQRIETILDEILDLPPKERGPRLEHLTTGEEELRREVESLLAEDVRTRGPLDSSIDEVAGDLLGEAAPSAGEWIGRRIGAYRVLRELGRGGMGEVLLAERADGLFEHHVALKIVRGETSAGVAERFTHERNILARLRHPNIASLYDGGTTENGRPYFAMEFVDGERITAYCDRLKLDVDARLALFESVCHAVHHAHRNLIIHRDLKPSNVLVTSEGVVKLLDFGIAKVLDPDDLAETTTQVFMTPAYAAPEQVLALPTSTATDVYSLGVLLYELLSGQNPHGDTSRSRSVELARAIVEDDPRPVSEIAGKPVRRKLRGDLDNILEKALRKTPEERYASVEALRLDLERHRRSLPVSARPATLRYRVRKFVRRNRVGTAAGIAAAAALLIGVAGVAWQARVASHERDRAREEAKRASAVKDYLLEVFSSVDPTFESGESMTALQLAERGAARLGSRFESDPAIRTEISQVLGKVMMKLAAYDRADTLLTAALQEHRASHRMHGVVETLMDLGEVARWRGELDDASRLMEEAVATSLAELPPNDPRIAKAYAQLAIVRSDQNRFEEAEAAMAECLRRTRATFGPGSLEEAEYLTSSALAYKVSGKNAETESALREALAIHRAKGGGENGVTMSKILSALCDVLDDLDRLEEAEAAGRESVEIMDREYGEIGHPEQGIVLSNLAGTVRRLNRLAEAESMQVRAIEIFKKHLGDEHYYVARQYNNLSLTRMSMGNVAGAESLQTEAIRLMKKQLGDRHASLVSPMQNHGNALLDLGRGAEAEAQYREALSIAIETYGETNLNVSYPMLGISSVLRNLGRYDEAERYAREAWDIRLAAVGKGHSQELSARLSVVGVLRLRGRTKEARELLDATVADAQAGLPATQEVLKKCEAERAKLDASGGA